MFSDVAIPKEFFEFAGRQFSLMAHLVHSKIYHKRYGIVVIVYSS